jgi:hypothetical protein
MHRLLAGIGVNLRDSDPVLVADELPHAIVSCAANERAA